MITKGQLKFRIGYSLGLGLMLLLAAGFDYLIKNTTTATSECRPPVEMTNNPRFLVEKCDDGSSYVTDTEDGNKTFVASGETKRVCTMTAYVLSCLLLNLLLLNAHPLLV